MMQENNNPFDHLELVYEMNRLFLSFLQGRAQRGFDCLGLSAAISDLLRRANDAQLDQAAGLPHALFRLDIPADGAADAALQWTSPETIALFSLQSKLLLGARILCRQNAHLAQTFLGLPARTLIRLRCLVLIDLANVAEQSKLVAASFADEPWLWRELLNGSAPVDQRKLRLIALQPRAADMTPGTGDTQIR